MGALKELRGQVVGVDAAPIIYLVEANPVYLSVVEPFFNSLDREEFSAVTSATTLAEVLVHPYRRGDPALVEAYFDVVLRRALTAVVITTAIAVRASQLRARYRWLRTPDALQLAAVIEFGATFFVTNDVQLRAVREIQVLTLDQL